MEGSVDGIRVAVFDYHFTVGGGKSQTVYHQTVCAVCDRRLRLPVFDLKPESIWNKLGALFGYEDIDFEEHPEFSRKYFLSGVGEAAVRALFRPEVRDTLEKRDGLSLEGAGDRFICFRANVRVEPGEIENLTRETLETLVCSGRRRNRASPLPDDGLLRETHQALPVFTERWTSGARGGDVGRPGCPCGRHPRHPGRVLAIRAVSGRSRAQ
jgi:hypothetical protein